MMAKKLVYNQPDGRAAIVNPVDGSRRLKGIKYVGADGKVVTEEFKDPVPAYSISRKGWPIPGVEPIWAETEDEFVLRVAAKSIPAGVPYTVVDEATIPQDRTFRNALEVQGGRLEFNMVKCRMIHRDRIRETRARQMASLDVEYMRADERGDVAEKKKIADKKQALRDATADPAIDAAQTPEQLKAAWPAILDAWVQQ